MDCREFRNKHVAFVDDLLLGRRDGRDAAASGDLLGVLATGHGDSPQSVLVRNLPPIEPSPDFMRRLNARSSSSVRRRASIVVAPRPYLPVRWRRSRRSPPASRRSRIMAVETTHYFAPAPTHAARRRSSRRDVRNADAATNRERRVRRLGADGNSRVARGADGRPGADALREHGFHEATRARATRRLRRSRRVADFFCSAVRADRILLAMSPVVDAKALRAAMKERRVRAGLLLSRRRRLPEGRRGPARSSTRPSIQRRAISTSRRCAAPMSTPKRSAPSLEHAADDGRPARRRRCAT